MMKRLVLTLAAALALLAAAPALAATTSVTLAWDHENPASVSGYHLFRATTPGGPYTQIANVPAPAQTYVDAGLVDGTYYYVATAYDASSESTYSNELLVIADTPPAAPTGLRVTVTVTVEGP